MDICDARNAILNARINQDESFTREKAVEAVNLYIDRLYDYYEAFGDKTISALELSEFLANIC